MIALTVTVVMVMYVTSIWTPCVMIQLIRSDQQLSHLPRYQQETPIQYNHSAVQREARNRFPNGGVYIFKIISQ